MRHGWHIMEMEMVVAIAIAVEMAVKMTIAMEMAELIFIAVASVLAGSE